MGVVEQSHSKVFTAAIELLLLLYYERLPFHGAMGPTEVLFHTRSVVISLDRSIPPSSSQALEEWTIVHAYLPYVTIPTSFLSKMYRPKAGTNLCVYM